MSSARPQVSVLIPCHNQGEFLDEAIDSVLAQTSTDFEIVIVDDGSTEAATRDHLDGFRRRGARLIRAPHAGLAAARNRALAESTGRYVCALDADDRLDQSFLERTVAVLEHEPSVAFASAWLRAFGDDVWEWKPERCDLATLLSENTVLTAALVRRDALEAVGGYDRGMPEQGDEDWDLWLTLVERGYRGVIVPEVLFYYRRRAGSMSSHCWHGPGHLPLARYRVEKHHAAYQRHLFDVLQRQDGETAALLRRNDELERSIATELEPAVTLRREELAALRAKLAEPVPDARLRELEAALHAATAEVAALRGSASWRVTGPLRDAYGWWLRLRGGP
jgi:glycosyltransferase involved in cell wall biosynthesis